MLLPPFVPGGKHHHQPIAQPFELDLIVMRGMSGLAIFTAAANTAPAFLERQPAPNFHRPCPFTVNPRAKSSAIVVAA